MQNPQLDGKGGVEMKENDRRKVILNGLEIVKEIFVYATYGE